MSTGIDIPKELKIFDFFFSEIAYRHDASTVFSDFLQIVVCCMGFGTNEDLYFETIKRYDKKEMQSFCAMLGELIKIYTEAETDQRWTDPLGIFYEALAGKYKKSALGQFFTPETLCTLIAEMTTPESFDSVIYEPCSGSGRMLLAANQKTKGMYFVAMDIDPICVKMTAINLCFHNIRAEVHCMDAIRLEKPYFTYAVNHNIFKTKTPHIIQVKPSE